MSLDVIIYAIIAVVLLVRLWSVFGQRNDSDEQRPNPFIMPAPGAKDDKNSLSSSSEPQSAAEAALLARPLVGVAPASLAGGLEQIKALDPSFDEKAFLQGARSAFAMIVENFAKGDMTGLERLLGPKVMPHFQNAIDARKKAGQTIESQIVRIRDAETIAARVEDAQASVTVRFVSEQQNVLRDTAGHAVGGGEGMVEEITDIWTFSRDTKSANPNWILAETRS